MKTTKLRSKHLGLVVVLILAAGLLLNGLWSYREFVRAESYFALGARLMIESGNWLAPHAPDEELLNKPPLTYWLIGLAYKIAGVSYGAARLPSVIAALALLALVYWFGLQFGGLRSGLLAASMLGTSYLFVSFARTAMSDMLLTLFVTSSLLCFTVAIRSNPARSPALVLVAYITLGLGVLTKGPVALALVLVPVGAELLIRRSRSVVRQLQPMFGLLILGILTAPYFALIYFRLGAGPLRFFFIGENLQRFTGSLYGWSQRPAGYELAAFFWDFCALVAPVAGRDLVGLETSPFRRPETPVVSVAGLDDRPVFNLQLQSRLLPATGNPRRRFDCCRNVFVCAGPQIFAADFICLRRDRRDDLCLAA